MIIAIIGLDGSGKSTFKDGFSERLVLSGYQVTTYHWRPGILPYRNNKKKVLKYNFCDPYNTPCRNSFLSICILLYIYLDFILGYFLIKLKSLYNRNLIILWERPFLDILISPERYGIKVGYRILNFVLACSPRPEALVILETDAKTLLKRKNEIPLEIIDQKITTFKKIASTYKCNNKLIVDTQANSIRKCIDSVWHKFMKS